MTPKTKKASLTQKEFRAAMRRIDAHLRRIDQQTKKMQPDLEAIKRLLDE
jgi:hypothetical protein